jgi:4-amino-4-deoxy-L-arabinose transferase-like glycosyltransferase
LSATGSQHVRPYLLLTLLCAALFLPGLASIPPTDRDEARFMQASKQMLESGDWVHIRFQEEPRSKKPVGIYWMQAAAAKIFGQDLATPWPYRLPSVLGAWLAVLLVCRCGQRLLTPAAGLVAGAVLASSFIVVVEAHIAKTDAMLLATTTLALTMLAELYVRPPSLGTALLFWLGIGLGILIKGPVIVLVAGMTIAALCIADRDITWLKKLRAGFGIPLALLIVLPWLIAVSGGETQGSFLADAVTQDLLPKLLGGQESHGAPPGSYLLTTLLTAWPWSVLAPFVVVAAWKHRTTPVIRFCLAWLIPAWIVFEIVPTKLPHYTMPLYPALALLTAWALREAGDFQAWACGRAALAYRILWACVAVTLGAGILYANKLYGDGSIAGAALAAGVAILAGLFALIGFARVTGRTAVLGLTAASVAFTFALTSSVIPHLRQLAISPRLAAIVAAQATQVPVALAGFHEPSAIFLLGTSTILTDGAGAAAYILATPKALAVIPEDALEAARASATQAGRGVTQLEELYGYNYSRGDWLRLAVITAAEPQP